MHVLQCTAQFLFHISQVHCKGNGATHIGQVFSSILTQLIFHSQAHMPNQSGQFLENFFPIESVPSLASTLTITKCCSSSFLLPFFFMVLFSYKLFFFPFAFIYCFPSVCTFLLTILYVLHFPFSDPHFSFYDHNFIHICSGMSYRIISCKVHF